jgi:hypothetical protein
VVLLTDHVPSHYHQWVFVPGHQNAPVTIRRDALGRGVNRSIGEPWILMICNNSDCPARAAIRARFIEEQVEIELPVPESVDARPGE